jgi:tellurium resistance protein TerD
LLQQQLSIQFLKEKSQMALSVVKGSALSVTKANGTPLHKIRLELSWDPPGVNNSKIDPKTGRPFDYDYDITAVIVNSAAGGPLGKGIGEEHVCYFNQKSTPAFAHTKGDSKNGVDAGKPDEIIEGDLSKIPANGDAVPLIITIYEAGLRGQTFDQVPNAKAELFDNETGEMLATFPLAKLDAGSTSALFAVIKRDGAGWKIENASQGFAGKEIGDFFALFGF